MNIINKLNLFNFEIGAILIILIIFITIKCIYRKRKPKVFSKDTEIEIEKLMRNREREENK